MPKAGASVAIPIGIEIATPQPVFEPALGLLADDRHPDLHRAVRHVVEHLVVQKPELAPAWVENVSLHGSVGRSGSGDGAVWGDGLEDAVLVTDLLTRQQMRLVAVGTGTLDETVDPVDERLRSRAGDVGLTDDGVDGSLLGRRLALGRCTVGLECPSDGFHCCGH